MNILIRTVKDAEDYLIVEDNSYHKPSYSVFKKSGDTFVRASKSSWKDLSWAESEVKALINLEICEASKRNREA